MIDERCVPHLFIFVALYAEVLVESGGGVLLGVAEVIMSVVQSGSANT